VFLEEAIERELDTGYTCSFDKLLEVMSNSDNMNAQYLAKSYCKCGADISLDNDMQVLLVPQCSRSPEDSCSWWHCFMETWHSDLHISLTFDEIVMHCASLKH